MDMDHLFHVDVITVVSSNRLLELLSTLNIISGRVLNVNNNG